jgi:hypothetical protein
MVDVLRQPRPTLHVLTVLKSSSRHLMAGNIKDLIDIDRRRGHEINVLVS